jgi:hypothetical protein
MIAFVSDTSDVCPAGVVLTVINDTDSKKNGAYFVASCPTLDNPELPVKVDKIGSGEILSAENYNSAKALATADMLGSLIYVSADSDEGTKGFYIVSGDKDIQKLGTAPATGDLSSDVANLKSTVGDANSGLVKDIKDLQDAVSEIEVPVTDVTVNGESVLENGIASIVIPEVDFTEVNEAIAKKVDAEDGYRLISEIEGTKLANISEGAQVNVIEKIFVGEEELVVDSQNKSVKIVIPEDRVRGLADGEKVLSLDEATGKLGTTLSIEYFRDANDNQTPKLRLKGIDGAQIGNAIDVSEFVKDGMLTNAEIVENPDGKTGTFIRFTWNTDSDKSPVITDLDVTNLIDVYTSGDGINVNGKVIKAVAKANDPYIEVTTEGIASKGIDNAILVAKNAVIGTVEDAETAVTVYGAKKYAANLVSAHESAVVEVLKGKVDVTGYNEFVTNTNNTLAGIKVTDVDSTETAGVKLVKSEAGVISVSVNSEALVNNLVGATGAVGPVSGTTVKLGQAITDGAAENPTEIISATTSVHSAIQTLAGQIQAAVAGGITAIDGGEYITVGGTATSKTLAVNVAKIGTYLVDNSTALKVDADGKITLEWENVE